MKKKIIMPVGIVTCLSLVSASALSGCDNNSTVAVSVKNVVDFNWDIINSFYNTLAKSFTEEKLKEQKEKENIPSDDVTESKPSSQDIPSERVGNSPAVDDKSSSGQSGFAGNNAPPAVIYETVAPENTVFTPEIISVAVLPSDSVISDVARGDVTDKRNSALTPSSSGNVKASAAVKTEVKDNKAEAVKNPDLKADDKSVEEEMGTIIPSDETSHDVTVPPDNNDSDDFEDPGSDHEHEWIPYDPDGGDSSDDPVVMPHTVYKEVIDNSRTTTYSDSLGNPVCLLTSIGTVDTFEDGMLVSSEGEEKAGTIEVHNLLTDEISTFMPGELEDPHDYVCDMFDDEVFPEGRTVGPSFGTFIEVFDNNYDSFYSDSLGNTICRVRIHDTIDKYENDVLVSSESEYEVGTIEIHNLVTDERFLFEPGTMDDYEEYVMKMFNGEAYYSGSLIGPAYAEPVDDDGYAYEEPGYDDGYVYDPEDDSDFEYSDDSEVYYICTVCGEII